MKYDIRIGKPRHFRLNNDNITACGIVGAEYMSYDARDCDCNRCRKTKKFKVYMGIIKK